MKHRTQQRQAIVGAFSIAGRPLGPQEILEIARDAAPSLSLATVYRTLKRLREDDVLVSIELPGEPPRYQLRDAEGHHHHHFRCTECHGVFCMHGCVEGLKGLLPRGFRMTGHDITIYGLCRTCST